MLDRLQLTVQLGLSEKILKPLKAIQLGSGDTAKSLKAVRDKLKELNDEQSKIAKFNKTVEAAREASAAYKKQKEALSALVDKTNAARDAQASMVGAVKTARAEHKALMSAFAKNDQTPGLAYKLAQAKQALDKLEGGYQRAINATRRLKEEVKLETKDLESAKRYKDSYKETLKTITTQLKEAGIGTKGLADRQTQLASAIEKANQEAEKHGKILQRMSAAQAAYDKRIEQRNKIAGAGVATSAAGTAMGLPIIKFVKDYASFEDAMLGVARQVDGAKDANGRYTQTYYEMGDAIKAMSERIPLATTEIAAIVEAGARMGIQGKENLLTYTETTAIIASAFDLPVDQVGDDVAKIAALYKVPIKSISELGDTINWLDDNALAKGGDIIDVMKRIAGTADTVGMKYKDAAALASTFLSLGATSEVSATASNAIMTNLSIATMQPKRFQEGLGMIGMSGKGVQQDMSKDATGTILKVMDAIKKLPQAKQLEATTRLFGKEFGDDAAKLAANLGEYRRQLELTNAAQAKGSMQREADSRNQALSARYEMLTSTIFNVSSALGESLKPALVDIMQSIADVLSSVRDWTKEHPALTANLIKGAAIIATIVTGLGALLIGAAAVLGPLAGVRFLFSYIASGGLTAAGGLLSMVNPMTKLAMAFSLGYAAGSYLTEVIDNAISRFAGYKTTLGAFIFDMIQSFKSADWKQIGSYILTGIEAGLEVATAGLYSKIKGVTVGLYKVVKETLGIHSPSRVFAELGNFTMLGLEQGIMGGQDGPLGAVARVSKQLAGMGIGIGLAGTAMAQPITVDTRPPLGSSTSQSAIQQTFSPVIQVYGTPGMNEQQLAQAVVRELEKLQRQQAARTRSRLSDTE